MILFIQYSEASDAAGKIQMQVSGEGHLALYDLEIWDVRRLRENIENLLQEWPPRMEYGDLGLTDPDDIPF